MQVGLGQLANMRRTGTPRGITSVCSAHPVVLRAALRHGKATGATVLIEATCNQVNHEGGYTDMVPAAFFALVETIAREEHCPMTQVILGGDHLGPNPWRDQAAEAALSKAEEMVSAYVAAGFSKIHLDCSMGCAGEPAALDDETTASRAVRLARVAEDTARKTGNAMPTYVIGTEVPPPGGADHALTTIEPTAADAAKNTLAVHREKFAKEGLSDAFERVVGIVVQPGVEFGNHNVIRYERDKAASLIKVLDDEPNIVFEAHSTDYQGSAPLAELVDDGFAILKVGPELTFVLREALYALDLIASDIIAGYGARPLKAAIEDIMVRQPDNWASHYDGDTSTQHVLRHYSLSDRIRYYWATDAAQSAVADLMTAMKGQVVPLPVMWQHFAGAEAFADEPLDPEALLIWSITESLKSYHTACNLS